MSAKTVSVSSPSIKSEVRIPKINGIYEKNSLVQNCIYL